MRLSIGICGDSGSNSAARLPSAIDSSNRPWNAEPQTELIVSERVIRIERERPSKFALAALPIELVEKFEYRQRGVRFGGIVVQLDRFLGGRFGLGLGFRGA